VVGRSSDIGKSSPLLWTTIYTPARRTEEVMRTPHFATSLRPPPSGSVIVQKDPAGLSLIKVTMRYMNNYDFDKIGGCNQRYY
jgi:hypothetical protein